MGGIAAMALQMKLLSSEATVQTPLLHNRTVTWGEVRVLYPRG